MTPQLDLEALVPSWLLTLRAARRSPATLESYRTGTTAYLAWCADTTGQPAELTRRGVSAWMVDLLARGREPATVQARLTALKSFAAWLTEEGEIPANPLHGIERPALDTKVIQPLTDDDIRLLLKTCAGQTFHDRRDEAMLRLMIETTLRAGEVVGMVVGDVDVLAGRAVVRRGKGGKGRIVPFGPQTARALDRYLRARRRHKMADVSDELWLPAKGTRPLSYQGLYSTLTTRARDAGIPNFHPHLTRHTAAHRWLAAGGSEGGLMAVAGWTRPEMMMRYSRARAADRAAEESRHLRLDEMGD